MKSTGKQDNPIVVGILVITLIGLIGLTYKRFAGDGAAAPSTTGAPTSASPSKSEESVTKVQLGSRDPFVHPVVFKMAEKRDPETGLPVLAQERMALMAESGLLPPMPFRARRHSEKEPLTVLPIGPSVVVPTQPLGMHKHESETGVRNDESPTDPTDGIKLTAIMAGMKPTAIIETAGSTVRLLHEGETLNGLAVKAIHATEVVLIGKTSIYTLTISRDNTSGVGIEDTHGRN